MSPKAIKDLAAEPELEIRTVPLDLIDVNEQNPNEVPPDTLETLKMNIRDHGFVQPIVVTADGERFKLIDGEHRVEVLRDLGYRGVPAVVVDADGDEAMLKLLAVNKLRGNFLPVRLAMVLADLVQRVPRKEVERRLGMSEPEMADALKLANFTDDVGSVLRDHVERESQQAPTVLRFVLTPRDAEIVERVIGTVVDGKRDRGQALAHICRNFERTKGAA